LIGGRIVEAKGIFVLAAALNKISPPDRPYLLIAGAGEDEARFRKALESNETEFEFLGVLRDIRPALERADMLVHPSLWEGLPLMILEAGLLGKPVIASRTDGIPEAIEHNVTGLLVNSGDADELAKGIVLLCSNSKLADRLGANLQRRVKKDFTIERMYAQVQTVYDSATAEK
jgi:glycosyltransferase involved in cell wall biosynthesis